MDLASASSQLGSLFQDLGPPWLATSIKFLGFTLLVAASVWRWHYWVRERALKINAARFKWLHELLKQGKQLDCPELLQELSFQRAYAYRYEEDEIAFALARRNPSQILHDLRYGRPYARLTPGGTTIEQVPAWLLPSSLPFRLRVVNATAFLLGLGLVGSFVVLLVNPPGGLLLFFESAWGLYMMFTLSRGLDCAIRLCAQGPERMRRARTRQRTRAKVKGAKTIPGSGKAPLKDVETGASAAVLNGKGASPHELTP